MSDPLLLPFSGTVEPVLTSAQKTWLRIQADPERAARYREKAKEARRKRSEDPAYRAKQAIKLREWRANGLTIETLEDLRRSQMGCCAVCGCVPNPRKNGADGLNIDHRHDNGAVRGLLCSRCNTVAGVLDADQGYLRRLAEYVQRGAPETAHLVAIVDPARPILREVA